ncbi:MAG: cytochrome c oxidase subunit I, partial [Chloroflexi bacterium]|nr:cytochrome c oxidase subunit I [Chloroflexota bacterium]
IPSLDLHISDTYFIVGHFHYVMAVAGTFAIFAGVYYIFPKMTGRMYNETIGKIGFWLSFVGTNVAFWTQMEMGLAGMPRRYYDYAHLPQFENDQMVMTIGSILIGIGFMLALGNWIQGAIWGEKAPDNPWGSNSLEWTTVSPPPHGNWPEIPTIDADWHPYNYRGKR